MASAKRAVSERQRDGKATEAAPRAGTRDRLLSAALSLFADRGFDSVTTAEIAMTCDVSQSVVLYYFTTKDQLWREAMRLLFDRLAREGPPRIDILSDLDEISRLKVTLRSMVQTAARFPELGRVVMREGAIGGERLDWLRAELLAPHYETLTRFFTEAAASGKLKPCSPIMSMIMIQSAASMLFNLAPLVETLIGRSPFDAEMIEEQSNLLVEIILTGLIRPGNNG